MPELAAEDHHFETAEARQVRELYNAIRGHGSLDERTQERTDEPELTLFGLPCAAGVTWVDLPVELQRRQRAPRRPTVLGDGLRFLRRMAARARRFSTSITFTPTPEKDDADGPQRRPHNMEERRLLVELRMFEMQPRVGAEAAKADATLSARRVGGAVRMERTYRQLWRVTHGRARGLRAELAKLRATERAKLVLRDFDHEQAFRDRQALRSQQLLEANNWRAAAIAGVGAEGVPVSMPAPETLAMLDGCGDSRDGVQGGHPQPLAQARGGRGVDDGEYSSAWGAEGTAESPSLITPSSPDGSASGRILTATVQLVAVCTNMLLAVSSMLRRRLQATFRIRVATSAWARRAAQRVAARRLPDARAADQKNGGTTMMTLTTVVSAAADTAGVEVSPG
jgi:hypothetical protein